jgi:membrane-associated protein
VAVARVIPLVRAFTGLVAGFMEVPLLPFEIFNLIGTLAWAAVLSVIGYEFGSEWTKVSKNFSRASDALAVLVVLLLVALIVHKAIELRKERQADAAAAEGLQGGAASGRASDSPEATAWSAGSVSPSRPHSHRRTNGGS